MTGLVILTFIPLFVAVGFLIRARTERKARILAEQRLHALETRSAAPAAEPEWHAVLAHELRSPVAAILGYQELLEEGTFGDLSPAALDAVIRIRFAASQLIPLIEGLEHNSGRTPDPPEDTSAARLIDDAIEAVRFDADGRGTIISREGEDVPLLTRHGDAVRTLVLLLGAAVKASPGAVLTIAADDAEHPRIFIRGTRLEPAAADAPLSGPVFRIQLARSAGAIVSASIDVDPEGTVHLTLPRLTA
jgi:signal transduction histidine kinase